MNPPSRFEDVAGCLRCAGRAKTVKQMEDASAKEAKERRAGDRY